MASMKCWNKKWGCWAHTIIYHSIHLDGTENLTMQTFETSNLFELIAASQLEVSSPQEPYCSSGSTIPGSSCTRTSTNTSVWVACILTNEQPSFVLVHWSTCFSRTSAAEILMSDADSGRDKKFCLLKWVWRSLSFGFSSALFPVCCRLSDAKTMPEDGLFLCWPLCCRNGGISTSLDLAMLCHSEKTQELLFFCDMWYFYISLRIVCSLRKH